VISENNVLLITPRHLDLSRCQLGLDGGVALANGLRLHNGLRFLSLSDNDLKTEGGEAIMKAVTEASANFHENYRLRTLDLYYNRIGGKGTIQIITDMLSKNRSLEALPFQNNLLVVSAGPFQNNLLGTGNTSSALQVQYDYQKGFIKRETLFDEVSAVVKRASTVKQAAASSAITDSNTNIDNDNNADLNNGKNADLDNDKESDLDNTYQQERAVLQKDFESLHATFWQNASKELPADHSISMRTSMAFQAEISVESVLSSLNVENAEKTRENAENTSEKSKTFEKSKTSEKSKIAQLFRELPEKRTNSEIALVNAVYRHPRLKDFPLSGCRIGSTCDCIAAIVAARGEMKKAGERGGETGGETGE
jgi:hypothetical protein